MRWLTKHWLRGNAISNWDNQLLDWIIHVGCFKTTTLMWAGATQWQKTVIHGCFFYQRGINRLTFTCINTHFFDSFHYTVWVMFGSDKTLKHLFLKHLLFLLPFKCLLDFIININININRLSKCLFYCIIKLQTLPNMHTMWKHSL